MWTDSDGNYVCALDEGTWAHVALFTDKYTVDTVPKYQSKGYENELLVCRQYNPSNGKYIGIPEIVNNFTTTSEGYVADARALVERARVEAQINKITYSEPIRVTSLSKKLCDMLQLYTQNGGVRPFGSALIIGGIYNGKCKLLIKKYL